MTTDIDSHTDGSANALNEAGAGALGDVVEISPAMVQAGVAALRLELGADQSTRSALTDFDPEAVRSVFRAMMDVALS